LSSSFIDLSVVLRLWRLRLGGGADAEGSHQPAIQFLHCRWMRPLKASLDPSSMMLGLSCLVVVVIRTART
jgi:hypothetical protein